MHLLRAWRTLAPTIRSTPSRSYYRPPLSNPHQPPTTTSTPYQIQSIYPLNKPLNLITRSFATDDKLKSPPPTTIDPTNTPPTTTTTEEVSTQVEASEPGEMPDSFKQATGLERAEIEYPDLFKHNEVLRGGFGTKDNPVKIPSAYNSRIVGCTGREEPNDHELNWLEVEKDEITVCDRCGQCFIIAALDEQQ